MTQFTACRTGVDCFQSIVERFGWTQVSLSIDEIFRQEEMDKESVRLIPDGEYSAEAVWITMVLLKNQLKLG